METTNNLENEKGKEIEIYLICGFAAVALRQILPKKGESISTHNIYSQKLHHLLKTYGPTNNNL